jgi:hypothetical protein
MNFADVYFFANEQLRLDDLLPITKDFYQQLDKEYWNPKYQHLSYKEWKEILNEYGYDTQRIKRNPNIHSFRQFFYQGDYFTVELHSLDPAWLTSEFALPCLKVDEHYKKEFENKNYHLMFFPETNPFAIDYFIRWYKQIDKSSLWEIFKMIYTFANYGFSMFPEEMLEEIFSLADNQRVLASLREKGAIDKDGYVTIYRGEGKRSTPLEKAYSWTLSLQIAQKFAHHFEVGNVYRGKVKAEKIIDYDNERNEEEVLVRFKDIEDIEVL